MIDIVYLAYNRLEFTRTSFGLLLMNTDWSLVSNLIVYDDGSTDGTLEYLRDAMPHGATLRQTCFGSPVAVMVDYLSRKPEAQYWAKIDSDVALPPGWLNECLAVMQKCPELDLLGIEVMGGLGDAPRCYLPAPHIGGIGLFRQSAFASRKMPEVNGTHFGFTAWQDKSEGLVKGWIDPAMPVCLLDRVPVEPYRSLSAQYVAAKWQRPWGPYAAESAALWDWFV